MADINDPAAPAETAGSPQPLAMPQAPDGLSEEAKQQALDVRAAIGNEARDTTSGMGEPPGPQIDQELASRQFVFERSVIAEDIQRTNDVKGPGE